MTPLGMTASPGEHSAKSVIWGLALSETSAPLQYQQRSVSFMSCENIESLLLSLEARFGYFRYDLASRQLTKMLTVGVPLDVIVNASNTITSKTHRRWRTWRRLMWKLEHLAYLGTFRNSTRTVESNRLGSL